MPSFPDRLKELRKLSGLSQKGLAEKCGLSEGGIQSYELELRKPSMDAITKLADCFNVSTDYLLGRSDNPTHN